jgi:hypothetical protein
MSAHPRFKSLFDNVFGFDRIFPDEPIHKDGFFESRTTTTYTTPVDETINDSVEYKVVTTHSLSADDRLEDRLNELGAEGWELKVWDGSRVIFMRFAENEDEEEESESERV